MTVNNHARSKKSVKAYLRKHKLEAPKMYLLSCLSSKNYFAKDSSTNAW